MNNTDEKLENIEDVLQQLVISINRFSQQEVKRQGEKRIPDYTERLDQIYKELAELKQENPKAVLNQLVEQLKKLKSEPPAVKQHRFLLFPETNQGQYYKIVFGRLLPWGLLFVAATYCFSLGQKALEVWKMKDYNDRADQYVKAWLYLDEHTENKVIKKRMAEAWQKANR
ncbi:hypothetical protein [Arcticibacter sp. MXS-1]|uniref:hypothetical protein n=1 Tax=Arcticibacter sp. MXS-1 TaxID=3341726 RepID=UPI0035A90097